MLESRAFWKFLQFVTGASFIISIQFLILLYVIF